MIGVWDAVSQALKFNSEMALFEIGVARLEPALFAKD
jgi:hypothetical protein